MITKFKLFESDTYLTRANNLIDKGGNLKFMTTIDKIEKYLKIDYDWYTQPEVLSEYGVDVIDFIKEIFLGKFIVFTNLNATTGNQIIRGIAEDVSIYRYQTDYFIEVKINKKEWYLIDSSRTIIINEYDAEDKPLHKEVKLKKEAEKYNL